MRLGGTLRSDTVRGWSSINIHRATVSLCVWLISIVTLPVSLHRRLSTSGDVARARLRWNDTRRGTKKVKSTPPHRVTVSLGTSWWWRQRAS